MKTIEHIKNKESKERAEKNKNIENREEQKKLETVCLPEQLRKLSLEEKENLAEELRQDLLETVSKTGGHLASNLGVVELTIALHSCFDTPKDKIIWDVGHQTYIKC